MNENELKRMNKGFMRKDGKFFLPVTHESLVVDNDGVSINEKYLTSVDIDGFATEQYVRDYVLQAQVGGDVDLSDYAKVEQLEGKVDKEEGKSLVPDDEIARLATLVNYDDTEIRGMLTDKAPASHDHDDKYAAKDAEHTHENKAVLDDITLVRMNYWDSKSDFSGSYNDLTDKPEIPSIEGLATQQFVEDRIADAQLGSGNVDLTNYATKVYVDEEIDKIELTPGPKGDKGDTGEIGPQGPAGVDGKDAAIPNFTFAVNMIASDQDASVSMTGTYPDLTITFNIPKGTDGGGTEVVDPGVLYMYYGKLTFAEVGNSVIQFNEITADMIKTGAGLTKVEAGSLGKTIVADWDDSAMGDYVIVALPVASGLTATQDNGLGAKTVFNDEDAGANGEVQLDIDGVAYKLYGQILLSESQIYIYVD